MARLARTMILAPVALLFLARCSSDYATSARDLDGGSGDGGALVDTDVGAGDAGVDAAADGSTCFRTPYVSGQPVTSGALCGVGACRVVLEGDCPKASLDGSAPTACGAAFPAEACANATDDNCDGVLNEGCLGAAAASAGTQCVGCAAGRKVKRSTDGTISGQSGNYLDSFTTTDCINSTLCSFGSPGWVRHMAGQGITCAQFCQQIDGSCVEQCVTVQPPCDPPATSINQGGQKFGTYAEDYGCMEMGPGPAKTTKPNTGSCTFVPTDYGYGPMADNRFKYSCCCVL